MLWLDSDLPTVLVLVLVLVLGGAVCSAKHG
jgi:hypothetical protein